MKRMILAVLLALVATTVFCSVLYPFGLRISGIRIDGDLAVIDVATNGVCTVPVIEFKASLDAPCWVRCEQDMVFMGGFWRATCTVADASGFFRAVDPGLTNQIHTLGL